MTELQRKNFTLLILLFSMVRLFSVQVSSVSGPSEVETDELLNLVFEVFNDGGAEITVHPEPILPQGWKLQFPLFPLTLEPDSSDILFLSCYVPPSAKAGEYQVGLTFPEAGEIAGEQVTVLPVYDFEITLLDFPPFILNSSAFVIDFSIQNTGNVEIEIDLSGSATYMAEGSFTENTVTLLPQESRELHFSVELDPEISKQSSVISSIVARMNDGSEKEIGAISQWIPPIKEESLYRYFKFSTSAVLSSIDLFSDPMEFGTTLGGSGFLDDENYHKVSLSVPTPSFSLIPLTPTWSTGSFSYENPVFSINQNTTFQGTSLVPGLDASGLLLSIHRPTARAELFSSTGAEETRQIGAKTYLAFGEVHSISMSWTLNREDGSSYAGLSGFLRPYDISNIHYSAAVSVDDPQKSAFDLQLSALEKAYRYSLYFSHKSAAYLGSATGEHVVAIEGSLFPSENASFSGKYTFIDRDRIRETYKNKHTWGISAGYLLSSRSSISASVAHSYEYVYTLGTPETERATTYSGGFDTILAGIELKMGMSHFTLGEYPSSQIVDLLAARTLEGIGRVTATTSLDTGSSLEGFSDSLLSSTVKFTGTLAADLSGGCDLSFSHAFKTGLSGYSIGAHAAFDVEEFGRMSTALTYSRLPSQTLAQTLSFSVSFSTSFNVPVGVRGDVSEVKGKIIPHLPSDPIDQIIVTIGNLTAVTDKEGSFNFPAVPKGTYQVILRPGISTDTFILIDPAQTLLELENQSEEISIEITRPISVTGTLDLTHYEGEDETGLILTLSSETEEQRKIPNREGSFSFTGLLPALWSLSVIESTVPEGYTVEFSASQLDLTDGKDRVVQVTLKPVVKEITFQGGGEYIVL